MIGALLRFKSGDEMVLGGVSDISSLSSSFLSGDFFLVDSESIMTLLLTVFTQQWRLLPSSTDQPGERN